MKLRSITLSNVRRFTGAPVTLDGLGDGLNVVAAPNEAGKSTFFEALEALLFTPHRSGAAEARSLRPYAGGAPEVAAEVELACGRYRVEKRWLTRPTARVTELPSGRVVAQDDEAEAWIADRLAFGGTPALLWVHQGTLGLEPDGRTPAEKTEQDRLARIRRDLLSSVARELDAVTGGRRLDAIAARCAAELGKLATSTGRPKKDGPWGAALAEAEALAAERDRLDALCTAFAADLAEHGEIRAALAAADDPAAARARRAATDVADRAAAAAREHRSRLDAATAARRVAVLEEEAARAALASHDRSSRARAEAETAAAAAAEAATTAAARLAEAVARETAAGTEAETAREAHRGAGAARDRAERTRSANEAAGQAAALAARLGEAEALAAEAAAATAAAAAIPASDADLRAAREADTRLERARARMEAGAVTLAMDYLPGTARRVRVDGRPLEPGVPVACAGTATLDLPGLGRLTLAPGGDAARAAAEAAEAEAALAAALARTGAADVAALAALVDARTAAEARAAKAAAVLASVAPAGLPALAAERDRLAEAATGADPTAPDPIAAATAEAAARAALQAAEAELAAAREARLAAGFADEAARARHAAAESRRVETSFEAAALPGRSVLAGHHDTTRASAEAAGRQEQALRAALPDVAAAEAALAAARAAERAAEAERHRLATRDAELAARIAARADDAVEERRDEAAGRCDAAEARAAGYAAEAAALARLRDALAAARAAARERYLAPVAAELAPLLAGVLGDAELRLDQTRLLPESLARGGLDEALDRLSGGTREQIAILTRLAFARLLARTGRATPVILDDALVYADDGRFARVLAALADVAAETGVQVVFLTCRERAFAALPARRPRLLTEAPPVLTADEGY